MARHLTISLDKRGVSCTARLLEAEAPLTSAAVWDALPQSAQVYHGKYARNEIYTLVPGFAEPEPGLENSTVTPIPGDVCYFNFTGGQLLNPAYGYEAQGVLGSVVDLALFYGRNNLLINGDVGWVPGTVFATVIDGLDAMADACNDLWMRGVDGETLTFARA
jgi:hypothetical protein